MNNWKPGFCLIIGGIMAGQISLFPPATARTTLEFSEILVTQETGPNSQTDRQATGRSRRRDVRYRFECSADNQTVLALYKGSRSRSSRRVSWRRVGERQLIQWTDEAAQEFGEEFTARSRCRAVTTKFNQHFLRQSNQPTLPPLSEGVVNGMPVICAATADQCNPDNILWTLKQGNRGTNGRIIAQLLSALKGEAGSGMILESEDDLAITSIPMDGLIDALIIQESDRLDSVELDPDETELDDEFGYDYVELED